MKISKVLIVGVALAIVAYFVVNGMNSGSGTDKAKAGWFTKLDANGDGKLSPDELKAIDTNGDGKISAEEAKAYGIPEGHFNKLDVNGDGFITQDEMKTYGG
ncbi:EF-hand domain-containing protein [Polynucleobacter alcilacus]|uniref:EF-hand domain-containing protein n=1 Tax=Polynucleobacter alcilacus TaxID=1819739 RepID=UPI001C0E271C|nr:EF-hand domain-containing protein [Polynucleobacter alcilacus]MBU3566893.1 EF-hand domain-containing protein [Polynucleobacter alcilacus]